MNSLTNSITSTLPEGWRERAMQALCDELAAIRRVVKKRRTAQGPKCWGGAKRLRTPHWADQAAIREVYREAQRMTRETGIAHHVDHEIPLNGRLVSGLHVHNNLQILTRSENSRKRNRFEV